MLLLAAAACGADKSVEKDDAVKNGPVKDGPVYIGMCDASAAVAIDAETFLVANDEDYVLRAYRRDRGGERLAEFDMAGFLKLKGRWPETDVEGATWLGDRVYWITSHGRNRDAKERINRYRFFATDVKRKGDKITVTGVGKPYENLLIDMVAHPPLAEYRLLDASRLAPKAKGGFNIEGLAATPDGELLIGLRNPIPGGKALLIPLVNPKDVIDGKPAKLGRPIKLDLGKGEGRGVRSIEYHAPSKQYVILAGDYKGGDDFAFYTWSGKAEEKPLKMKGLDFGKRKPEAIVIYPNAGNDPGAGNAVHVLSDDGTRKVDGQDCKLQPDPLKRSFRSAWIRW